MEDQRPIIELEETLLLEKTAAAEKKKIIDELEKTLAAEEEKVKTAVHPYEYTIAQQKASIERLMARVSYVEEKLVHFVSMVETCIDTSSGALNYAEWADGAIEDLSVSAKEAAKVNDHLALDNRAMKDRVAMLVSLETKNKALIADMTKLLENEKRVREQLKYPDTTPASIIEARKRSASMDRIMRAVQAMPDAFDWHHVETLQSLVAVAASLPFGFSAALENLDKQAARAERELKRGTVTAPSPYEPCSNCKFMSDFVLQIISKVTVNEDQILYAMANGASAVAAIAPPTVTTTVSRIPLDDGIMPRGGYGGAGKMMAREGGVGDLLNLSSSVGGGDIAGDKKNLAGTTSPSDLAKLTFISQQPQTLTPTTTAEAKKNTSSSQSSSESEKQPPMSPGTAAALASPPVQPTVPPVMPPAAPSLVGQQQPTAAAKAKKKAEKEAEKKAAAEEAEKKKALMETTQRQASTKKFDLDNVPRIVICLPPYLQGDGAVLNDVFESALRWTGIIKKDKTSDIVNNPNSIYNVAVLYLINLETFSDQSRSTFYESWRVDPTWMEMSVTRNEYSKLHTVKSTAYRYEGSIMGNNLLNPHNGIGVSPTIYTVYPCIAPSSGYTSPTFELKNLWLLYTNPKIGVGGNVFQGDANCGSGGKDKPEGEEQNSSTTVDRADPMFRTINPNTKILKLAFVAFPYPKSTAGKCKLDDMLNMQGGNLSSNMNLLKRMVKLLPGVDSVNQGTLMVFFIAHLYDPSAQKDNVSNPDQFKRVPIDIVVEIDLAQKTSARELTVVEKNLRNINRENIANYWWKHESLQNYINRYFDNMTSGAQSDLFTAQSEKVIAAADYAVYLASLNTLVETEIQNAMFLPGKSKTNLAAGGTHETDPFYMPQTQESSNSDFCSTNLKTAWELYCTHKVARMNNYAMKGFKKSMLFIVPVYFRNDSSDGNSSCNDNFYRNIVQYLKTYYLDNISKAVELWTDSLKIPLLHSKALLSKFDWQINLGFLKFEFAGNFFPVLLNSTLHILPYNINSLTSANMGWNNIITTHPHKIFEDAPSTPVSSSNALELKNKNFDAYIFSTSMWMPSDGNYVPLKSKVSLSNSSSNNSHIIETLHVSAADMVSDENFCKYYIPPQSTHAEFYKYVIDRVKDSIDHINNLSAGAPNNNGESIKLFGLTGFGYTGYGDDRKVESWEPSTNTYAIMHAPTDNYIQLTYNMLFDSFAPVFKAISKTYTRTSLILPTSNAAIAVKPSEWTAIPNWYDVYAYINGSSTVSETSVIPLESWDETFTSVDRALLRKKLQPLSKFYDDNTCAVTRYHIVNTNKGFFSAGTGYRLEKLAGGAEECTNGKQHNVNRMTWIQIVKSPFFQRLMNPLLKPVTVFNTFTNTFVIAELKLSETVVYRQIYDDLKSNRVTELENATATPRILFDKSEIKAPNKCPYNIIDVNGISDYLNMDISNNFTSTNIASAKELNSNLGVSGTSMKVGLFAEYKIESPDNFTSHSDLKLPDLIKRLLKQCLTPPAHLIGQELIFPEFDNSHSNYIVDAITNLPKNTDGVTLTILRILHYYVLDLIITIMHLNLESTPFVAQELTGVVNNQGFLPSIFDTELMEITHQIINILNRYAHGNIPLKFKDDYNEWKFSITAKGINLNDIINIGLLRVPSQSSSSNTGDIFSILPTELQNEIEYTLFDQSKSSVPLQYRKYIIKSEYPLDFKLYQSPNQKETELLQKITTITFNDKYVTPDIKCTIISGKDVTNLEFTNDNPHVYCNGEFMISLTNEGNTKDSIKHMLEMLSFKQIKNNQIIEIKSVPAAFLIDSKTFRHQQEVDAMYRPAWVEQIIEEDSKTVSPSITHKQSVACELPTKENSVILIDLISAFVRDNTFTDFVKVTLSTDKLEDIINQLQTQIEFDIKSRIIHPYKNSISIEFIKDIDKLNDRFVNQLQFYDAALVAANGANQQYDPTPFNRAMRDYNSDHDFQSLMKTIIDSKIIPVVDSTKRSIYHSHASNDNKYYYVYTSSMSKENPFIIGFEPPPCRPYWQKFFFIIHVKIPDVLNAAFELIQPAPTGAEDKSPLVNETFQLKIREIINSSPDAFGSFEDTVINTIKTIIGSIKNIELYDRLEFIISDLTLQPHMGGGTPEFRNYGWVIPVSSTSKGNAIATPDFYSGVYIKVHDYIQTNATSVDQIFHIQPETAQKFDHAAVLPEIRKNIIPDKIALRIALVKSLQNLTITLDNYNSNAVSNFYWVINNTTLLSQPSSSSGIGTVKIGAPSFNSPPPPPLSSYGKEE